MSNEQRVMSFRKKPLVIQAMRLVDDPSDAYVDELHKFMEDCVWSSTNGGIAIDTMEGTMHASPGDWIIRGIGGEYYPCKPEIFAVSYEPAKSAQQVPADGDMARALEAARLGLAPEHVAAIEEAIAAYPANAGGRTVKGEAASA